MISDQSQIKGVCIIRSLSCLKARSRQTEVEIISRQTISGTVQAETIVTAEETRERMTVVYTE